MKKCFFYGTVVLLSSLLMACETVGEEPAKQQEKIRILSQSSTPYAPLLDNAQEIFAWYSFTDMHMFQDSASFIPLSLNDERNTIVVDNQVNLSLNVQDTCIISNAGANSVFNLYRSISLNNYSISTEIQSSIELTNFDPIKIIRPNATECDPMPFCYYEKLEIEWNAAEDNENGVIIIAEWNGSNAYYDVTDHTCIITADVVEDNGAAVLSNEFFTDMPHGALVNLWVIRATFAEVDMHQNRVAIDNFLTSIQSNTDLGLAGVDKVKKAIYELTNPLVVNATVSLLPIILVKDLRSPNE